MAANRNVGKYNMENVLNLHLCVHFGYMNFALAASKGRQHPGSYTSDKLEQNLPTNML